MEVITQIITQYNVEIIIGLAIISILLVVLNLISQLRISKMTKKYNRLVEGVNEVTLEDILFQHLDEIKAVKNALIDIKEKYKNLDGRLKFSIQKVGVVRYNAFNDMGSDLSFSIALLDDNLNGFVLSSIFGRNESNTYAKPIVNGKSNYTLSVEEIQAIDKAKKYGLTE